jgi:voltage-gated potassium channel
MTRAFTEDRALACDRFTRATEGPMTVLALALLPLILIPLFVELSPGAQRALEAVDWLIWALFAAEYGIKLYLAPDRWRFVRTHVPDLILVLLPLLRPLRVIQSARVLRVLRLARVLSAAAKGLREARNIIGARGLNYVLLVTMLLVIAAASAVHELERGQPEPNITDFPDALWWAVTTVTTVGYGDRFPISDGGRAVAVLLMVAGIALFGIMTASIAAWFVEQKEQEDLRPQLDEILARLESIERRLEGRTKSDER